MADKALSDLHHKLEQALQRLDDKQFHDLAYNLLFKDDDYKKLVDERQKQNLPSETDPRKQRGAVLALLMQVAGEKGAEHTEKLFLQCAGAPARWQLETTVFQKPLIQSDDQHTFTLSNFFAGKNVHLRFITSSDAELHVEYQVMQPDGALSKAQAVKLLDKGRKLDSDIVNLFMGSGKDSIRNLKLSGLDQLERFIPHGAVTDELHLNIGNAEVIHIAAGEAKHTGLINPLNVGGSSILNIITSSTDTIRNLHNYSCAINGKKIVIGTINTELHVNGEDFKSHNQSSGKQGVDLFAAMPIGNSPFVPSLSGLAPAAQREELAQTRDWINGTLYSANRYFLSGDESKAFIPIEERRHFIQEMNNACGKNVFSLQPTGTVVIDEKRYASLSEKEVLQLRQPVKQFLDASSLASGVARLASAGFSVRYNTHRPEILTPKGWSAAHSTALAKHIGGKNPYGELSKIKENFPHSGEHEQLARLAAGWSRSNAFVDDTARAVLYNAADRNPFLQDPVLYIDRHKRKLALEKLAEKIDGSVRGGAIELDYSGVIPPDEQTALAKLTGGEIKSGKLILRFDPQKLLDVSYIEKMQSAGAVIHGRAEAVKMESELSAYADFKNYVTREGSDVYIVPKASVNLTEISNALNPLSKGWKYYYFHADKKGLRVSQDALKLLKDPKLRHALIECIDPPPAHALESQKNALAREWAELFAKQPYSDGSNLTRRGISLATALAAALTDKDSEEIPANFTNAAVNNFIQSRLHGVKDIERLQQIQGNFAAAKQADASYDSRSASSSAGPSPTSSASSPVLPSSGLPSASAPAADPAKPEGKKSAAPAHSSSQTPQPSWWDNIVSTLKAAWDWIVKTVSSLFGGEKTASTGGGSDHAALPRAESSTRTASLPAAERGSGRMGMTDVAAMPHGGFVSNAPILNGNGRRLG